MSRMTLSKGEIDALVTVALRWTETGVLKTQPADVADILRVTPDNATEVGSRLWSANHDAYNYGGPPSVFDPSELADWDFDGDDGQPLEVPEYEFEPFPGVPHPLKAIRLAGYYRYQTENEYWERRYWPNGQPLFEMLFHQAMVWTAAGLLGLEKSAQPQDYSPYESPIEDQVMDDPAFKALPWGIRSAERDLFLFPRLCDRDDWALGVV